MVLPANPLETFVWGSGGVRKTPEQIARDREIAQALAAQGIDYSPVAHPLQGLARVANAAAGAYKGYRADQAAQSNAEANQAIIQALLGGGNGQFPPPPSMDAGVSSGTTAPVTAPVAENPNVGSTIDFARAQDNAPAPDQTASASPMAFSGVVKAGKGWTTVQTADGQTVRRVGSRGWRNNNPGNIEYGPFAKRMGAIGSDGRFAVFPSLEAGRAAKEKLLFESPNYRNKTLAQAIHRWAPPSENNTKSYYSQLARAAGVDPNTRMADLTPQQRQAVLAQMEVVEGFRPGKEEVIGGPAVGAVTAFANNEPIPPAPVQVASLDPSAGMAAAANPVAAALASSSPEAAAVPLLPPPRTIADAPVAQVAQAEMRDPSTLSALAGGTAGQVQPGMTAPNMQAIAQALASPYADETTKRVALSLLSTTMQQQQAEQAAQAELARRQQAAQAAGINPMFATDPELWKQAAAAQFRDPATATVGNVVVDTRTGQPIYEGQAPQPTSVQEYQFYAQQMQQAGQQPLPYDQWDMARRQSGATNITVGGDGAPGLGKLSTDYGYVLDPLTGKPVIDPETGLPRAAPVPGSPAARELATADQMRAEREGQGQRYGRIVLEDIGRVLSAVEENPALVAGPFGSLLANLPGTGAHDVSTLLNTIRANVGFDRLQSMRAASPTGGALGAVSDSENKMLQSTLGALEQSQSPEQFARNLRRLQNLYTEIVHGPAPAGVSDDEWTKKAWGGATAGEKKTVIDGYEIEEVQ